MNKEIKRLQKLAGLLKEEEEDFNVEAPPEWNDSTEEWINNPNSFIHLFQKELWGESEYGDWRNTWVRAKNVFNYLTKKKNFDKLAVEGFIRSIPTLNKIHKYAYDPSNSDLTPFPEQPSSEIKQAMEQYFYNIAEYGGEDFDWGHAGNSQGEESLEQSTVDALEDEDFYSSGFYKTK